MSVPTLTVGEDAPLKVGDKVRLIDTDLVATVTEIVPGRFSIAEVEWMDEKWGRRMRAWFQPDELERVP